MSHKCHRMSQKCHGNATEVSQKCHGDVTECHGSITAGCHLIMTMTDAKEVDDVMRMMAETDVKEMMTESVTSEMSDV